jgi:4a-hydroxytetrahydrobiopterin dehydratase
MPLLTDLQREELVASYPDWVVAPDSISRTVTFDDFTHAMGFVTKVAIAAEKAFHHPDIDIRWNKVTLTLSTHDEGGLTEHDVAMAATIDRLI